VQQRPELFAPGQVEGDAEPMGPRGALVECREAPGVKRGDGIADGLGITPQVVGDLRRLLPASTGEQDLGPAVDERIGRAQAGHQLGAFGVL
jgi:hypothetical protein